MEKKYLVQQSLVMELRLHLHELIMGQGHREARETCWCRGSRMQPLCPKPSSNHCSSPTVGCREGGGIFWAALLGKTSPRVLILSCLLLLFCLTPPPLPSLQSLTSLFYGEQSEKEKSPSESSPLDADNKDVVSASGCGSGDLGWAHPGPACPVLHLKPRSEVKWEKLNLLLNTL